MTKSTVHATAFGARQWFETERLVLLVDVGSSSVGCALLKIEKGVAPHILVTSRENISFQESLSSAKFLLAMNHALERSLKAVQLEMKQSGIVSRRSIEGLHIFCTFSSPWFILKNRHLSVWKKEPFKVTAKIVEEFINQDIENLKSELKETLPPKDILVIEKRIIQIRLNGYDIASPYDQVTSQMDIDLTVGVSSLKVVDSVKRKIGQFFHTTSVQVGVFPIAAFSAVRDIFPTEKGFLFLDITGEATDVAISENDLLVGAGSFSRGRNFFIREISTKLGTPHEEANTLFSMYLRGELPVSRRSKVGAVVTQAGEEWLARFEKTTSLLSLNTSTPIKVFFTTDADIAKLFEELIAKAKTGPLNNKRFEVQYIDQLIVAKFVTFAPKVARDPFLVIESLFVEKIIPQYAK